MNYINCWSSSTQIQPECGTIVANPGEIIYRIDGMFPAIDNLEIFPTEILLHIFARSDDIGLLRFASINQRFGAIARTVFKERYTAKCFVIKSESKSYQNLYWKMFREFGRYVKAIEVNKVENIDEGHWMARMLQKCTENLDELYFNGCSFQNPTNFLAQHTKITRLTFGSETAKGNNFALPNYRDLKQLRLSSFTHVDAQSLEATIRNNPLLESLELYDSSEITFTQIMRIICQNLKHLKELEVVNEDVFGMDPPPDDLMDEFAEALKC